MLAGAMSKLYCLLTLVFSFFFLDIDLRNFFWHCKLFENLLQNILLRIIQKHVMYTPEKIHLEPQGTMQNDASFSKNSWGQVSAVCFRAKRTIWTSLPLFMYWMFSCGFDNVIVNLKCPSRKHIGYVLFFNSS